MYESLLQKIASNPVEDFLNHMRRGAGAASSAAAGAGLGDIPDVASPFQARGLLAFGGAGAAIGGAGAGAHSYMTDEKQERTTLDHLGHAAEGAFVGGALGAGAKALLNFGYHGAARVSQAKADAFRSQPDYIERGMAMNPHSLQISLKTMQQQASYKKARNLVRDLYVQHPHTKTAPGRFGYTTTIHSADLARQMGGSTPLPYHLEGLVRKDIFDLTKKLKAHLGISEAAAVSGDDAENDLAAMHEVASKLNPAKLKVELARHFHPDKLQDVEMTTDERSRLDTAYRRYAGGARPSGSSKPDEPKSETPGIADAALSQYGKAQEGFAKETGRIEDLNKRMKGLV